MEKIRIQFTLFSAFYSPLISTMSGGFLKAEGLDPEVESRIHRICKRTYRALYLSGYARIDLRLTPQGEVYVLEANPNPDLSRGGEFAEAAGAAGMPYAAMIERILRLGLSYRAQWQSS